MLALTAAGLWSAEAGFLDVARHFGFDVTSNRGRLRAQAWMNGVSDAHFDAVERRCTAGFGR